GEDEHRAGSGDDVEVGGEVPQGGGEPVEVHGAGRAVQEADPEQHDRRGDDGDEEQFQRGLGRGPVVAAQGGEREHRQRQGLQGDDEEDEVAGGDEGERAGHGGEQEEVVLPGRQRRVDDLLEGQQDHDDGRGEDDPLEQEREVVGDVGAGGGAAAAQPVGEAE